MKRKMLAEEKAIRQWCLSAWMGPENKKQFRKDVAALTRAVRIDERLRNQCECEVCASSRAKK